MLDRLFARKHASRVLLGAALVVFAVAADATVRAVYPQPPFIPHSQLGNLVIDAWMIATGHIDWPSVLSGILHGVPNPFDY